jgi:translation initiation factor 2B subunit (eIF-2B alpha/beta/delta family)|tara:strand:- start:89 stop:304 length:216 start_codon:yes stop_codon:yes gene_type:complete
MKEQTLIQMKKQMESMINVQKFIMEKLSYLDTVCVGTLETIKNMPDYDQAIEKIKNKIKKEEDGNIKQNIK